MIGLAAVHFLSHIDPVGVPFLQGDETVRDVWVAIGMRADRIYREAAN